MNNNNMENMSKEEKIAFLKLRELIIHSHEEGIKRRSKHNGQASWSSKWWFWL